MARVKKKSGLKLAGMGSIPYEGGCVFRVWAPNADAVFVSGTFNNWSKDEHPLSKDKGGFWSVDVPGAGYGDEYRYIIVNGGIEYRRIDPYSRNVSSSVGNSIVCKIDSDLGRGRFVAPLLNEIVIYEMHVGTFAKGPEAGPGDLENAITRLPYLKELGINTIEVMPVMEFAGGYSWGYNPSQIFTIESDYGLPKTFKHFIKAAHDLGIAVIIDVVYNHFGPSDLDLWQFDGWNENGKGGIYFYNDWRSQTPWGDTRPDYGRKEVRQYILDNVLMWLQEYHIDGFRWDATAYIRNVYGNSNDPGGDLPDGWSLMQWVNDEIKKRASNKITIAEDLRDDPFITKETKEGGAGFDSQWDVRFVHTVREAIIAAEDASRNMDAVRDAIMHRYYLDAFERIIYTESHDEVANGRARVPEELDPGNAANWIAKKRSTLGAVLVFTSPGIPMIFQGQEFLEDDWFHDTDPIDWSKKEKFSGILQLYRDLIRLRLNHDGVTRGLCGQEVNVFHVNHDSKILAFHRWERGGPGDSVIVVVNMTNNEYQKYYIGLPFEGVWHVRFNSDSNMYDSEFGNLHCADVATENQKQDGLPFRGNLDIAPYSAIILSQGE